MKVDNDCYWCKGPHPSYKCPNKTSVSAVASNDRVMPDVVLEEIKKYKYKCSNPYCGRWNELAYTEHAKVVCEFCGIIAKTRKQA